MRNSLAGWTGLLLQRFAAAARRVTGRTLDADSSNVAVLCDPFLRYGSCQAMGLSQAGLNVTLYYVDRLGEFGDSYQDRALFLDRARAAGVELVMLPRRRIRSLLKDTLWLHRDLRRRRIATAVAQWHYDPRYTTLGMVWPVALIVHDPQPHSGDTASTFPLPVRAISRAAELTSFCLIVHSAQLFQQVRPLLRRLPVGVAPHGADMAPAPKPVPAERTLLVFGRLYAYKGVDTALEAFRSLPIEFSDVKLIVAGRGPMAAIARGLPNVDLREGYVADGDIDALLGGVRLVLLAYKDATQSGVGLQAVARGVPCVVSRAGGLPELVQDVAPELVVPPDDPEQLARAIIENIDHEANLRTAIYEHAATHFTWQAAAQRLCSELTRMGLGLGEDAQRRQWVERGDRAPGDPPSSCELR
jgi:glycosyltransferase involved in cell wall biosynthesis